MDRDQAARIVKHLKDAGLDLEGAVLALPGLGQEEELKSRLRDMFFAVHLEILPRIYDQHPDLRPPPEKPQISGKPGWDKVCLPPKISEKDVDDVLFPLLNRHWQKVALVVGVAFDRGKELGLQLTYEIFAARLRELADTGRIEGAGDLRKWRHSEVRLKN